MKRRTFYIINLDRNRIFILTVLFVGLICVAYATGFRFGRAQGPGGVEALSYQDLMGLPAEDKSENAGDAGESGINPTDIAGLPEDHPVRQDEPGLDAQVQPALPDNAATMGQPGETTAPGRLPRIAPEEEPAAPARKERSSLNLQKRTQTAQAGRNRKESRPDSNPAQTERPLPANRTAPENTQSKKSIGDSLAANSQTRLKNREPSRLSFERSRSTAAQDRKTAAGRAAAEPKTGPVATPQESGKKTVALRNVSPGPADQKKLQTPPASNPAGAGPDREYSLQLGSYSDRDSAFRLAGSLKRHGFTPYVYRSGGKFAVRVGKTDRPQNLETLEERLREKRYSPMRISYRRQDR